MTRKRTILLLAATGLIAFLGAGVWGFLRFAYTAPLNQQELKRLTPDWSTLFGDEWSPWQTDQNGAKIWDPAGSFNDRIEQIPSDQRAWPELIEIYHTYPQAFDSMVFETVVGNERWSASAEVLEQEWAREAIDRLAIACGHPYLGRRLCAQGDWSVKMGETYATYDPDEANALRKIGNEHVELKTWPTESVPLFDVRDTAIKIDMKMGRLLVAAANHALLQEDTERYVRLIEAADAMGRFAGEFPITLSQTVQNAIASMQQDSIRWALTQQAVRFDESQLARLEIVLHHHLETQVEWRADALFRHDTIRRMLDADGNIDLIDSSKYFALFGPRTSLGPATHLQDTQLNTVPRRLLYSINVVESTEPLPTETSPALQSNTEWLETQRYKLHWVGEQFLKASVITRGFRENRLKKQRSGAESVQELIRQYALSGPIPETTETHPIED